MSHSYSTIGLTFATGFGLRLLAYALGFTAILAFLSFIPSKKCRMSTVGMYTFSIYILHAIVLRVIRATSISIKPIIALFLSVFASACICILFGNVYVDKAVNRFFNFVSHIFLREGQFDSRGIK